MASSGNDAIKLEVSGQVNRALILADDGDRSRLFHVDNDNSSTRVRWLGTGRLDDDLTVGALVEVQFESNTSSAIDMDQDGEVGANSFTERHLTLYLDSQRFVRLWAGQGDTATNGTSEVDLSGTTVINGE
ncbi:MAG: porin [Pseudomonadota bacterium]|nr:porin [Pseudomonadota bacterium]